MSDDGTNSGTYETQAVFTGCICPNVIQGKGIHEVSCPTQPFKPKKPALYAGKKAWRIYFKEQS